MARPARDDFAKEMNWLSAVQEWLYRKYPDARRGNYYQLKRIAKWKQIDQDNNERQEIMSDTSAAQAKGLTPAEPTPREAMLAEFFALTESGNKLSEAETERGLKLLADLKADTAASKRRPRESVAGESDRNGEAGRKAKPTGASEIQSEKLRKGY